MKPDKETQEELRQGESLVRLVDSEDWQVAKSKLLELMANNSSVQHLESTTPDDMYHEVIGKQIAVQIIENWVDLVEGGAIAHVYNKKAMEDHGKNDLISRF